MAQTQADTQLKAAPDAADQANQSRAIVKHDAPPSERFIFDDLWDYAPAPESHRTDIADKHTLFIDGSFTRAAKSTKWFDSINPATEEVVSRFVQAQPRDIDKAVESSRTALGAWSSLPGKERGKVLFRIARRLQERAREFAVLESIDSGKPIKESRDFDVPTAARHFFYYAGWADKLRYAVPGARTTEPVGVCAAIIPWNFPLLMAAWKIAPALAAGCTVVLKPAETTPLTAMRLAEVFEEVGLPPGVVNIVTGDGAVGAALAAHEGIDKIAFTGSTAVGKVLAKTAAERNVPITLELGGKSPNIIFADAAIDQAVEGIVSGIFFNQGQVCCAGSRLLVEESALEEVATKLALRMASIRVGDPLDKNTDIGPINSKVQLERIEHYVALGEREGAQLQSPRLAHWADGVRAKKGYWCRPCFFTGVEPSHTIAREEIFGPVLAVQTFRTIDEAIARANDTTYGLSAGVWTDKAAKVFAVADKLRAGVVWANTFNRFDPASPFGGYQESGFGREGGAHGLRQYLTGGGR